VKAESGGGEIWFWRPLAVRNRVIYYSLYLATYPFSQVTLGNMKLASPLTSAQQKADYGVHSRVEIGVFQRLIDGVERFLKSTGLDV